MISQCTGGINHKVIMKSDSQRGATKSLKFLPFFNLVFGQ